MLEGYLVPKAGIEPARVLPHRFLRPTRLPIPPLRHGSACSPERVSGSETRLQKYGFFLFAQVTFEKKRSFYRFYRCKVLKFNRFLFIVCFREIKCCQQRENR